MYLCTLQFPTRNMLVRVDLHGSVASYGVFHGNGTIDSYDAPAEDGNDAILSLVKELVWSEVVGAMVVVQAGFVTQDRIDNLLAQVRPWYELAATMTSETRQ